MTARDSGKVFTMAPRHNSSESESDSGYRSSRQRHSSRNNEDYRLKRDRNNIAVRKSREKSRQKARETMEKVSRLKKENEDLEMKVKLLSKELNLLKDLFLTHAGRGSLTQCANNPSLVSKTKNMTQPHMDSMGESDNSVDSLDGSMTEECGLTPVAGTLASVDVVQRDHEYSAPSSNVK